MAKLELNDNKSQWLSIAIALSAGFSASVGFGLIAPLYALRMDDFGISSGAIGLLVTLVGIAPLFFTPFIPKFLTKFALKPSLWFAILSSAILCSFLLLDASPFIWTLTRFLFAILGTFLFVASESWILEIAPEKYRGRILGIYAMVFYGGIGVGGILIAKLGYNSNIVIFIAIALNLLILPFFVLKTISPSTPKIESNNGYKIILLAFLAAPALFIPALAIGAIETAAFNLFPIWVRKIGFEDNMAGTILAAAALGNILLQGPIGILADKIGRIKALILISIIATIGPLFLININSPNMALWIVGIWSGFVTGFYTMGLMGIAEHFDNKNIAAANAAFGTMYCVGQFAAPSIGGLLMDTMGVWAFLISLASFGLLPLIALFVWRNTARVS